MPISKTILEERLRSVCTLEQWQWYRDKIAWLNSDERELSHLDIALAAARRKVGDNSLSYREDEQELGGTDHYVLNQWRACDAARVLLLLNAKQYYNLHVVTRAYQQGDQYEKESILKGMCLLDEQGELKEIAVDACRTNIITMMSSVALYNTYPEHFFSEHEFNQMVLKCLFFEFNIAYVSGLERRSNPSMSRMCYDYLRERRAADRDFPASIWLSIRIDDIEEAHSIFYEYLSHEKEEHRYNVACSLAKRISIDTSLLDVLTNRLKKESSEPIRKLITELSEA